MDHQSVRLFVDRGLSTKDILKAMGREIVHTNLEELDRGMPRRDVSEVDVVFFPAQVCMRENAIHLECKSHGLRPADPHSLLTLVVRMPHLADSHRVETRWQDSNGGWWFLFFDTWGASGIREVRGGRFTPCDFARKVRQDLLLAGVRFAL